jgi:hypothetical protein
LTDRTERPTFAISAAGERQPAGRMKKPTQAKETACVGFVTHGRYSPKHAANDCALYS